MQPDPIKALKEAAQRSGLAAADALHRHVLEGILRRTAQAWSRGGLDHTPMLRGGLMMQQWCAPAWRPTRDLDLLIADLDTFDRSALTGLIHTLLTEDGVEDGVLFEVESIAYHVLWPDSDYPGLRAMVPARVWSVHEVTVQLDCGFGDPLVPPATQVHYPTLWNPTDDDPGGVELLACRPESGFAWKVHGLFEQPGGRWQQKDLHDLYLMLHHATLDMEVVPRAIAVAFSSRNTPLSATERLLGGHFGHSRNSRRGWRQLRRKRNERDIPASLEETIVEVAERLRPLIAAAQSA